MAVYGILARAFRKNAPHADVIIQPEPSGITKVIGNLDVSGVLSGASGNTEVVSTTKSVLATDSGKTFFLNLAGGFTTTLPAPAAGLNYKFIVKIAPTTAYIIVTNGGANLFFGSVSANGASTEANGINGQAQDTINFVASQAAIGDWVELTSDGTNWYVTGEVKVVAGLTFAVT